MKIFPDALRVGVLLRCVHWYPEVTAVPAHPNHSSLISRMAHSNSSFPQRRNMILLLSLLLLLQRNASGSQIARTDERMLDVQRSDLRKSPIKVRLRSAGRELRYIPCLRTPIFDSLPRRRKRRLRRK